MSSSSTEIRTVLWYVAAERTRAGAEDENHASLTAQLDRRAAGGSQKIDRSTKGELTASARYCRANSYPLLDVSALMFSVQAGRLGRRRDDDDFSCLRHKKGPRPTRPKRSA